jgi:hypothetical protein
MKDYLQNLLPRIRQYSESLDKIELFIDKPWVILDEDNNQQKYIFRRNGELIMSLNGQATTGKWEYISAAKCLLIDRIKDKILLNQDFVDPAVMVLKMDGRKDKPFLMANEQLIPGLNIEKYLLKLYYKKNAIEPKRLESGQILELHKQTHGWSLAVTIDGQFVPTGILKHADSNKYYNIRNSKLVNLMELTDYKVREAVLSILKGMGYPPSKGDKVFIGNKPAPDGKYRIGILRNIHVKNGIIDRTSAF